jgi:hypothetical protein
VAGANGYHWKVLDMERANASDGLAGGMARKNEHRELPASRAQKASGAQKADASVGAFISTITIVRWGCSSFRFRQMTKLTARQNRKPQCSNELRIGTGKWQT